MQPRRAAPPRVPPPHAPGGAVRAADPLRLSRPEGQPPLRPRSRSGGGAAVPRGAGPGPRPPAAQAQDHRRHGAVGVRVRRAHLRLLAPHVDILHSRRGVRDQQYAGGVPPPLHTPFLPQPRPPRGYCRRAYHRPRDIQPAHVRLLRVSSSLLGTLLARRLQEAAASVDLRTAGPLGPRGTHPIPLYGLVRHPSHPRFVGRYRDGIRLRKTLVPCGVRDIQALPWRRPGTEPSRGGSSSLDRAHLGGDAFRGAVPDRCWRVLFAGFERGGAAGGFGAALARRVLLPRLPLPLQPPPPTEHVPGRDEAVLDAAQRLPRSLPRPRVSLGVESSGRQRPTGRQGTRAHRRSAYRLPDRTALREARHVPSSIR
mmetsp:Transcript_68368/g.163186  ORF Transcript_68368/g.163186 Transcript_68368/m.163186 type:complete len:369 (+) Transcript_68368:228-1334(+)